MNNITSKQRKYLKSIAHHIDPVVLIGKNGASKGSISSIDKALSSKELIKIKFREFKDIKDEISKKIATLTKSEVVAIIGHTLILFRQNSDPEKQKIKVFM